MASNTNSDGGSEDKPASEDIGTREGDLSLAASELLAPPVLEASQAQSLSSELPRVEVTYDPLIPHTGEESILVRYCANSFTPIHLCYQCFGELVDETTPVLLLVCGLNMQMYAWDEVFCEGLARSGFYVIRYDNRDIGLSTKVEGRGSIKGYQLLLPSRVASALGERVPYTLEDMAQDGLALLEALKIRHAHVMGISMGGMIAQTMALLSPQRVVSLTSIMSSTNASDLPDTQLKVKLLLLRKPPPKCSLDELLDFRIQTLMSVLPRALSVDSRYLKERYLVSLQRSQYTDGLIRQAAAIRRCPGRDAVLKQLTLPSLVIHGAQDLIVPPMHGVRTASVLPHARLLVFKHMGHYFHPAFYQTIILTFCSMAMHTPYPPASPSPLPEPSLLSAEEGDDDVVETVVPSPLSSGSPTYPSPTAAASATPTSAASPTYVNTHILRHSALQPLVVSPHSPCGRAVIASVDVAVPKPHSSNTPEAALLDLHAENPRPSPVVPEPKKEKTEQTTAVLDFTSADGVTPFTVRDDACWGRAVCLNETLSPTSLASVTSPTGGASIQDRVTHWWRSAGEWIKSATSEA